MNMCVWMCAGSLLGGILAAQDEIRLRDGSTIRGAIVAEIGEQAYVQTTTDALLKVRKADIREVFVPKVTSPERPTRDAIPPAGSLRPLSSASKPPKPIPAPASKPEASLEADRQVEAVLANEELVTLQPNHAIEALAKVCAGNVALLHWRLAGLLRREDPRAYLLLEAIGECRNAEGLGRVLPYLGHADASVRRAAAKAAGRTQDSAAVPLLVPLLADNDDIVVDAAVRSLRQAGEAGHNIRDPITSLSYHAHPANRTAAVKGMAKLGSEWCLARIVELFEDLDAGVRLHALQAAEAFGDLVSPEAAIRRLDDPALEVKTQACKLVGRLRAREAVPTLIFLLSSDREELGQAALSALHRISGQAFGADQDSWLRWWDSEAQKR